MCNNVCVRASERANKEKALTRRKARGPCISATRISRLPLGAVPPALHLGCGNMIEPARMIETQVHPRRPLPSEGVDGTCQFAKLFEYGHFACLGAKVFEPSKGSCV